MKKVFLILLALCALAMAQEKQRVIIATIAKGDENPDARVLNRLESGLKTAVNGLGNYDVIIDNQLAKDLINAKVRAQMGGDVRDDHIVEARQKYGAQLAFLIEITYYKDHGEYDIEATMINMTTNVIVGKRGEKFGEKFKETKDYADVSDFLARSALSSGNKGIFMDEYHEYDKEFVRNVRGVVRFQASSNCGEGGIKVRLNLTEKGDKGKGCIIDRGSGSDFECKIGINIEGVRCGVSGKRIRDINAEVIGKHSNRNEAERIAYDNLRKFKARCINCEITGKGVTGAGDFDRELRQTLKEWEKGE
jgi:hypothetical protein